MAVWNAAHGSDKGGMRSKTYKNWLAEDPARQQAYDDLVSAGDPVIPKYSFSINYGQSEVNDDGFLPLTVTSDGKYFVSDAFKVEGSSNLVYTVKAGADTCILYGNSCKGSQVVKAGEEFRLRTDYVAGEKVSVRAAVTSSSYLTGYNFSLFVPTENAGSVQNLSVFIPTFDKSSKGIIATGYDTKKVDLDVSKTDATSGAELPGATLTIKKSDGEVFDTWESTTEAHRVKGLVVGEIYAMIEEAAPEGYSPLKNEFYFMMKENGKVILCKNETVDMKKGVCDAQSEEDKLNIKNEVIKKKVDLDVSKTDATSGAELPGATLTIKKSDGEVFDTWESTTEAHRVKGLVVGEIYAMIEEAAPEGYSPLKNEFYFMMKENGKVILCKNETVDMKKGVCDAQSEEDKLNIKNEVVKTTKVVISKRDITTGKEVPGAHLQILDENGNVKVEWTSTENDYIIEGLEPGKYILVETIPAADYNAEMIISGNRTSRYEFEIKAGEVTKIDVYNEIIPNVPSTGISATKAYIAGGVMILVGLGTVAIVRKKETM